MSAQSGGKPKASKNKPVANDPDKPQVASDQSNSQPSNTSLPVGAVALHKFVEPGLAIALVTAIGFYIGSRKIGAFYNFFGLDHWQLPIPPSAHLSAALYPILFGGWLIWQGFENSPQVTDREKFGTS